MLPAAVTVPSVGGSRPARIRSIVDLPEPFSPIRPLTWPGGDAQVTWSSTTRWS